MDLNELLKLAPFMAPLVILAGLYVLIEIKVWTPLRKEAREFKAKERQEERSFREREIGSQRDIASMQTTTATELRITVGIADKMQERLHEILKSLHGDRK